MAARTDNRLTVRGESVAFRCPKGRRVAGMRYGTRSTGALDGVPATMLKVHGRPTRPRIHEAHIP
jgi:hypothetical protein